MKFLVAAIIVTLIFIWGAAYIFMGHPYKWEWWILPLYFTWGSITVPLATYFFRRWTNE